MGKDKLSTEPDSGNGEDQAKSQNALKPRRTARRNNYVDIFYISDMPAFKITPSIDKVKLSSIPPRYLNPITKLLTENGFKIISDTIPKQSKYDRIRKFSDSTVEIMILYNLENSKRGGWPILIEINDPTHNIIKLFDL